MTDLRQAAQMALEALESGMAFDTHSDVLQNLRTALRQPEPEKVAQPERRRISDAPIYIASDGGFYSRPLNQTLEQQQAEPVCPECKAAVLYECVACSSNNYPPKQQCEPVGWHYTNKAGVSILHCGPSARLDADMKAAKDYPDAHKVTPLYTTPPQRKPLTDKDILADDTLRYYFGQNGGAGPVSKQGRKVVDAIEAAHGIGEQK